MWHARAIVASQDTGPAVESRFDSSGNIKSRSSNNSSNSITTNNNSSSSSSNINNNSSSNDRDAVADKEGREIEERAGKEEDIEEEGEIGGEIEEMEERWRREMEGEREGEAAAAAPLISGDSQEAAPELSGEIKKNKQEQEQREQQQREQQRELAQRELAAFAEVDAIYEREKRHQADTVFTEAERLSFLSADNR
jgi:hypothetical protein